MCYTDWNCIKYLYLVVEIRLKWYSYDYKYNIKLENIVKLLQISETHNEKNIITLMNIIKIIEILIIVVFPC